MDEKQKSILCNFTLSSENSLFELNQRLTFDLICINNLTKNLKQPSFKFNHFNQNVTSAQGKRVDNCLLFIVNDSKLFNDYYIFNDIFYLYLNAKVKQIAFTNMKMMTFCSKFIQELFQKFLQLQPEFPPSRFFSANRRFVGARANNFWQYSEHSFRKFDKFVEI